MEPQSAAEAALVDKATSKPNIINMQLINVLYIVCLLSRNRRERRRRSIPKPRVAKRTLGTGHIT